MYPKFYSVEPIGITETKELRQSTTCVISIDEHNISLQQDAYIISIPKAEVQRITKSAKGTITIKGKESIIVPPNTQNYKELEAALNEIAPIENKSFIALCQQYNLLFIILLLILIDILVLSTNKLLVTTSSFILLGGLSYFLYESIVCRQQSRKSLF